MIDSQILANKLQAKHIGNVRPINKILNFSNGESDYTTLMWLSDKKHDRFKTDCKGTLIVSSKFEQEFDESNCTLLVVDNPRRAFQFVIKEYFVEQALTGIEDSARIDKSAIIGQNCYIGHNVVVEKNVSIGENTAIMHNTVILAGTIIGNSCKIGSNCTIGGVGFGYERNEIGEYELIYHIGNVVLHNNVEIGNNTCIDRAVLGSTIIRENVKVDNLVHIAHGCDIGKNSLVIANAMVAGSVTVGENVWIAPSSSILNQKSVASNAVIGMGAVVLKDIPEGDVVVGNPSKSIKK